MKKINLIQIVILVITLLVPLVSWGQPEVSIDKAMVAEPPPGIDMTAGYFDIHNTGNQPVSLIKVSCQDFGNIEIHRSMVIDGIAKMIRQESVTLPPNSSLEFKPGDYHLMMFHPRKQLTTGDKVSLTFYFSDLTSLEIGAVVMKQDISHNDHNHSHH